MSSKKRTYGKPSLHDKGTFLPTIYAANFFKEFSTLQVRKKTLNQCPKFDLRCVYTEYDEIFCTYSDVDYETVRGYDVKLRHYPRHSRIQSLGALQNNR